jgi:hypothetical protein
MHTAVPVFMVSKLPVYVIQSNHPGNSINVKCVGTFLVFFYCSTMMKNTWYPAQSNVSGNSSIFNCVQTLELPETVTICLICTTSVATIFVARRRHGSFSSNIQEELEAALLFQ